MLDVLGNAIPKDGIGPALVELADENEKIVVLSSDVSVSCNIEMFHEKYPRRFFEMGISEQSTMSAAGGLSSEGFIPFYVALAIFSCGMTWAQMRQVCNSGLGVKVIGTHAGVDDGQDGSGHHATEDIAITRAIPNMTVLAPSDINEVSAAIKSVAQYEGTIYMRVARELQPILHDKNCCFEIGKAELLGDDGDDFAIIYEGTAQKQALGAYKRVKELGYCGKLISIRTIKPIDRETVVAVANKVKIIVTVENHSVIGGLYGAVMELLGEVSYSAMIKPVAFFDEFMESGRSEDIKEKYGLNEENIVGKIVGVA